MNKVIGLRVENSATLQKDIATLGDLGFMVFSGALGGVLATMAAFLITMLVHLNQVFGPHGKLATPFNEYTAIAVLIAGAAYGYHKLGWRCEPDLAYVVEAATCSLVFALTSLGLGGPGQALNSLIVFVFAVFSGMGIKLFWKYHND
jgi:hypothetical protein